jgi:hypothetical protein
MTRRQPGTATRRLHTVMAWSGQPKIPVVHGKPFTNPDQRSTIEDSP